jgi:hypothetical protein
LGIANSGFRPFEYWVGFDQAASLIPPKAYCYANVALPPPEVVMPDYSELAFEQLAGPAAPEGSYGWAQLGGRTVVDALAEIGQHLGLPGYEAPPLAPPDQGAGGTPAERHACLTFAGTWAAPGTGYPSDVAQACSDVVEEIAVQAPWSFGPIPPGQITAPSYQESVAIAVDWACDWLLANPGRTFLLGGYSQGGEAAGRVYAETLPGGRLEALRGNYVAGYVFGNPSRYLEHTFYAGPPRDGEGIAQFRLPDMGDDWCSLCDTYDMYAGVPATLTGEIMRDVSTLCTELQLHDLQQFAEDLAANCIEIVQNLDGDAYDDLKRVRSATSIYQARISSHPKESNPYRTRCCPSGVSLQPFRPRCWASSSCAGSPPARPISSTRFARCCRV